MTERDIYHTIKYIQTLPDEVFENASLPKSWRYHYSIIPPVNWSVPTFQKQLGLTLPKDAETLWSLAAGLRLNEEINYGQWGLVIWGPTLTLERQSEAKASREDDFQEGDLIIGEFLGDSDLILLRCDPTQGDFGSIMIALPLDPRKKWYKVAESLSEFIEKFLETPYRKYWIPLNADEKRRMSLSSETRILSALRYEILYLQGQHQALAFATSDNSSLPQVRSIEDLQQQLESIAPQPLPGEVSKKELSEQSKQIYSKGYRIGLIFAINVISGRVPIPQGLLGQKEIFTIPEQAVFHKFVLTGAKADGLLFALTHDAHISQIIAEIEAPKEYTSVTDAQLDAWPRIYQEGYLAGLKEALSMIDRVEKGEDLPLVEDDGTVEG